MMRAATAAAMDRDERRKKKKVNTKRIYYRLAPLPGLGQIWYVSGVYKNIVHQFGLAWNVLIFGRVAYVVHTHTHTPHIYSIYTTAIRRTVHIYVLYRYIYIIFGCPYGCCCVVLCCVYHTHTHAQQINNIHARAHTHGSYYIFFSSSFEWFGKEKRIMFGFGFFLVLEQVSAAAANIRRKHKLMMMAGWLLNIVAITAARLPRCRPAVVCYLLLLNIYTR